MNRVALAVLVAILAASLSYALVVGTAMLRSAGPPAHLWVLFVPGTLWGAAFALAVLLPLWLFVRRDINGLWLQFGLPAIVLWVVISTALFAMLGLSPFEAIGNALTALPAGVAAVVAFILAIRGKPNA